jgi:hypothetical protein
VGDLYLGFLLMFYGYLGFRISFDFLWAIAFTFEFGGRLMCGFYIHLLHLYPSILSCVLPVLPGLRYPLIII